MAHSHPRYADLNVMGAALCTAIVMIPLGLMMLEIPRDHNAADSPLLAVE